MASADWDKMIVQLRQPQDVAVVSRFKHPQIDASISAFEEQDNGSAGRIEEDAGRRAEPGWSHKKRATGTEAAASITKSADIQMARMASPCSQGIEHIRDDRVGRQGRRAGHRSCLRSADSFGKPTSATGRSWRARLCGSK